MGADTGQALYDETAARASSVVLSRYSTSFGLGTKLLGARARHGIEAVYALVRIADEIVDTRRGTDAGPLLDEFEAQTARALESGYSTNLVIHAFARTAHQVGIGHAEIDPFFASMRMDLTVLVHDRASYERYVYGSAEVIGLMCLAVFLDAARGPGDRVAERGPLDAVAAPDAGLRAGAQALGAAFQKINFLRDLGADYGELGRSYFPGVTPDTLDQAALDEILAEIAADIATARASLPGLPRRARWAVASTLGLYDRLTTELAATPPAELLARRVRVPGPTKLAIVARSIGHEIAIEARTTRGVR
ncbi:phytoene/squalene synthase family protein [Pengzhenrongella frigida]|uniref:Squalene synthase n=1 Tax=Pengzhenrongella frigida TaxID=1259133 RepID=A0A4Q5N062_9MICO|nr:squalene/phytoene synthase family protein [Cellulomonas sp. HLT2-17]RYV51438.1 squalene synthase [Cellulomonas sp. HLT2-17]